MLRDVSTRPSWTKNFTFESVSVFKFWLCPGPLVLLVEERVERGRLWFQVQLEVKFSPVHMLLLHDLWFWSVVSEEQLSVSLNRTGAF